MAAGDETRGSEVVEREGGVCQLTSVLSVPDGFSLYPTPRANLESRVLFQVRFPGNFFFFKSGQSVALFILSSLGLTRAGACTSKDMSKYE